MEGHTGSPPWAIESLALASEPSCAASAAKRAAGSANTLSDGRASGNSARGAHPVKWLDVCHTCERHQCGSKAVSGQGIIYGKVCSRRQPCRRNRQRHACALSGCKNSSSRRDKWPRQAPESDEGGTCWRVESRERERESGTSFPDSARGTARGEPTSLLVHKRRALRHVRPAAAAPAPPGAAGSSRSTAASAPPLHTPLGSCRSSGTPPARTADRS